MQKPKIKERIKIGVKKASWRRIGWAVAATVFVAFFGWWSWAIWRVWLRYPPTDPLGAWTMLAGIGAMLTGLGTLALSGLALRGLESLRLSRTELIERAKNEAKRSALLRMNEAEREIIPANTSILDGLAREKIDVYLGKNEDPQFDPDPKDTSRAKQWVDGLSVPLYNEIISVLNRLEAWSAYFMHGVADERIAFGPIAPVLRSWVGQYYAVILILRMGPDSGTFPNLVGLYTVKCRKVCRSDLGARVITPRASVLPA